MTSCAGFRRELERWLESQALGLSREEWHEHLLLCGACRALLASEAALDELLATLPEPTLPPALARRVRDRLAAIRRERDALDALLEQSPAPVAPGDLSAHVLAGLSSERRPELTTLDGILERLPDPVPPEGLATRVLAGLAAERNAPEVRRGFRLLAGGWRWAAAALILVASGLALRFAFRPSATRSVEEPPSVATHEAVDDDLLVALDVLENWEVLMSEDVDLLLASLDSIDMELLGLESGEPLEYEGTDEGRLPSGPESEEDEEPHSGQQGALEEERSG